MKIDLQPYHQRRLAYYAARQQYHRKFAWLPVKTSDFKWVWLEFVWRRWLCHVERWSYTQDEGRVWSESPHEILPAGHSWADTNGADTIGAKAKV